SRILKIAGVYRSKLRDDLQGIEGDEIVRQHVEDFVSRMRPRNPGRHFLQVTILLYSRCGMYALPRPWSCVTHILCRMSSTLYKDDLSISLSTAYLFNYPTFRFTHLPVSLTISLSVFPCRAVITPPSPSPPAPALTLTVLSNFTLELQSISLLGSRAKLADVPKLHKLT
ncbi:hypothetical protein EDB83DRAFT_2219532, partial [Lactarius deliciosus]